MLVRTLPGGFSGYGDVVAIPRSLSSSGGAAPPAGKAPPGGALALHRDVAGTWLVALRADGSLRWQRSISGLVRGGSHLLALDDSVLLVSQQRHFSSSDLSVYAVDLGSAQLARVLTAGDRSAATQGAWVAALDGDHALLHLASTGTIALDVKAARHAALLD
jgi:hypothetical protein